MEIDSLLLSVNISSWDLLFFLLVFLGWIYCFVLMGEFVSLLGRCFSW